jgi:hypothetical protein
MTDELIAFLEDVPAATSRYGIRDDRGRTMDTLKVIENPDGGYLGVYHVSHGGAGFEVAVATSDDLLNWAYRATLDAPASQPTIAAVPGGEFLVAVEAGGSGQPAWLRFMHYRSAERLLGAAADRVFDAPHTLVPAGRLAEGTPNVYAVRLMPDIDHSLIDIEFHYYRHGRVDRQGHGRLTDFRGWSSERDPHLDAAIQRCGVTGNIGGRDAFLWRGRPWLLIEGQRRRKSWQSWRTFLYDPSTDIAHPLAIRTHGGSKAFANPTATMLTTPSGEPGLAVTLFLFDAGSAPGEAGPLLYFRPLP